jgi:hypothetical protein
MTLEVEFSAPAIVPVCEADESGSAVFPAPPSTSNSVIVLSIFIVISKPYNFP